jgi:hypothetical protein
MTTSADRGGLRERRLLPEQTEHARQPNTRGQMAVFLTKTLGLKLNGP